jgi:hypothetical protein
MSNGGPTRVRLGITALAVFNVLVGVVGGGGGLFLTAAAQLSVHPEDSLPPLGLAAASGLLGVAGVVLLIGWPRPAVMWAIGSAVAAAGGVAVSLWRHEALRPSEGGMLLFAGLTALVGLAALLEIAYLRRAGAPARPAEPLPRPTDSHKTENPGAV